LRRRGQRSLAGQNRARRRVDGPFEPDYHGVIETDDGATILWHLTGFGWPEEGRVVTTVKHAPTTPAMSG
jgi:hypothetical protein